MQIPGLSLSQLIIFDVKGMLKKRSVYSTAAQDCEGLTNQAIKGEVIMSSFSWASSKKKGPAEFLYSSQTNE